MRVVRLVTLALIAQMLATPVTSGMLVLCFGSDGHVAVESASACPCCVERDGARRESAGDPATTLEPPGPCCNDLQLTADAARPTVPSQKIAPVHAAAGCASIPAPPSGARTSGAIPSTSESPVAVSLRTVVLRD